MSENITPSLAMVLQKAIDNKLYELHTCLPARVEKYSHDKQKADVKPLLRKKYKLNNGTEADLPIIPNVPVQFPSADDGNAYIHFPIKKGDLGIVLFSERSLDVWLSGDGKIVTPDDPRKHDLTDGIFIPGVRPFGNPLKDTTEDEVILQRNNTCYVKMYNDGKIEIKGLESKITLNPDGKRELEGGDMKVTFFPDGTLSMEGASEEIMAVIDEWMNRIINQGYIMTCFGISPWIDYTKTLLNETRTKFQTLMVNPPGV